jgi:hypothetical protein
MRPSVLSSPPKVSSGGLARSASPRHRLRRPGSVLADRLNCEDPSHPPGWFEPPLHQSTIASGRAENDLDLLASRRKCVFNKSLGTEREGFEPSVPARVQRFSRPPRSTAPAPLPMSQAHGHVGGVTYPGTAPARKPWQSWQPHRPHLAYSATSPQPPSRCLGECVDLQDLRRRL